MIYEFDSCVLDTSTQELVRDGVTVHAEPQVLAVLEYLAANRGRVVTKVELLDEVWGDRFVSESALTSRIKWARKVCGDSGREQRIVKTIHSRGYRFVAEVRERDPAPSDLPSGPVPRIDLAPPGSVVGRDEEFGLLQEVLRSAETGCTRAVFVTGVSGSGTSTLIAEFIERNDTFDGWFVLRGRCSPARGGVEPYFSLLDAWSRLAQSNPEGVVRTLERVAPSWLSQLPSLVDEEVLRRLEPRLLGFSSQRMLREGVDALEELARVKPVLLAVDALQWADECTLDVLDLLMQRTRAVPLLLLASARSDSGAVQEVITSAVGSGRGVRVELPKLEPAAVGRLVRERFAGVDIPDELVRVVAERSDGVPMFAQEIVTAWLRQGLVEVDGGHLRVNATLDQLQSAVPQSLVTLIEQQLGSLDPADVDVLEAAAVSGIRFDGAEVAAGLCRPVSEVEGRLGNLGRRFGFFEAQARASWPNGSVSTRYSFTHRLYRDVVYERMTPGIQAEQHGRIGRAVEAGYAGQTADVAGSLADHFGASGETGLAIEYLRQAGELAVTRSAHAPATRFLHDALSRVDELPPGPERNLAELRVRVALGPALVTTRGWFDTSVRDNYERALALSDAVGPCPESASARYGMATVTELSGQFARTEELLTPLVQDEESGDLAMEAHELLACSAFHQAAFQRSVRNSDAVLESWDEDAYSVLMSRIAEHPASSCNSWRSLASWALGRLDDSLERAERAILLGELNPYALSTAVQQRAMLHQLRQEPEVCIEWAERTREVGGEQDFPMRIIQADIYKGWALGVSGSPQEGMRLVADGLERFRATGATLNEAYYLALYAETLLCDGQPEIALEQLDEALAVMREATRSYFYASEIHRLRAQALLAVGEGDAVASARTELDESREIAHRSGSPILEMRAVADRVRLEADHGEVAPWVAALGELVAAVEGQAETPDLRGARELLGP